MEHFNPCWIVFEEDGYDGCPPHPIKVFTDRDKAYDYYSFRIRNNVLDGIEYTIEESELEV